MRMTVPICDAEYGDIIDTVAWESTSPHRWTQETGIATIAGLPCLRTHYVHALPLQIWRTPARWIEHNEHGIVILRDWELARLDLLEIDLIAEDPAHARELQRRLQPPALPAPRVLVRMPAGMAA